MKVKICEFVIIVASNKAKIKQVNKKPLVRLYQLSLVLSQKQNTVEFMKY